ncbi:hypothetical protein HPB50_026785 [Hyalomma asiaticum]|uniref:Uncharacterized protein n=1 Tax=Hyalomma asiaticum TaxID=266040 RepID=A0ACB7STL5_HYAAI|nr:hypothetical protein HPB50_026785 [Hyalomma asiaticum]
MSFTGLQSLPPFLSSHGHPEIPWEQYIQEFENYMVASGASNLPAMHDHPFPEVPAAGEPSTSPAPDKFDRAIMTLESHYKSTVKDAAARHRFQQRAHAPDETAADYVTALRSLVAACNFGALVDDMIRDQLILSAYLSFNINPGNA